jgi:hypothetical protein
LQKLLEKAEGISPDRFGDGDEFYHVHPSFPAFHFSDKELRLAESVCELLLDHTDVRPSAPPSAARSDFFRAALRSL